MRFKSQRLLVIELIREDFDNAHSFSSNKDCFISTAIKRIFKDVTVWTHTYDVKINDTQYNIVGCAGQFNLLKAAKETLNGHDLYAENTKSFAVVLKRVN